MLFINPLLVCLAAVVSLAVGQEVPSNLLLDAPESVEFLKKYGYLNKGGTGGAAESLYSKSSVENALKQAQKFGGIPETGKLDKETMKLFNSKRCGLEDVIKNDTFTDANGQVHSHTYHRHRRAKRFIIATEGWQRRRISYHLLNWNARLTRKQVLTEMRKAFDAWAKYSNLVFYETSDPYEADIKIGFYRGQHGDYDAFDGEGFVLAHAFFPVKGGEKSLAGDIHFDDDEKWSIMNGQFDDGVDFSSVALHELGHSLGLSHSPEQDSIMNPYYRGKRELGYDDILAMHKLYGTRRLDDDDEYNKHDWDRRNDGNDWDSRPHYPHHHHPHRPRRPPPAATTTTERYHRTTYPPVQPTYRTSTRYTTTERTTTTHYPEVTYEGDDESVERHKDHDHWHRIPPKDEPATVPPTDGCQGAYDTISFFRGELFIIKDKLLWRLAGPGEILPQYPVDFHRFLHKLPQSVEKIDAIYERTDSKIIIFSGKRYWIFDGYDFVEGSPRPITDYGLSPDDEKVDAAMIGNDLKSYIFSGNRYWIINGTTPNPEEIGKQKPLSRFKGPSNNLDAALTYKDKTYMVKDNDMWTLEEKDSVAKKASTTASQFWLGC